MHLIENDENALKNGLTKAYNNVKHVFKNGCNFVLAYTFSEQCWCQCRQSWIWYLIVLVFGKHVYFWIWVICLPVFSFEISVFYFSQVSSMQWRRKKQILKFPFLNSLVTLLIPFQSGQSNTLRSWGGTLHLITTLRFITLLSNTK